MRCHSPIFRDTAVRVEIPLHLHPTLCSLTERTYKRGRLPSRGWTANDGSSVPADHISQLALRNLCKVRPTSNNRTFDRVELTDLGHELAAMVARAKREGNR